MFVGEMEERVKGPSSFQRFAIILLWKPCCPVSHPAIILSTGTPWLEDRSWLWWLVHNRCHVFEVLCYCIHTAPWVPGPHAPQRARQTANICCPVPWPALTWMGSAGLWSPSYLHHLMKVHEALLFSVVFWKMEGRVRGEEERWIKGI